MVAARTSAMSVVMLFMLPVVAQTQEQTLNGRKVVTLTNGQYPEFFENDTLRKLGRVWYNTVSGRIVWIEGAFWDGVSAGSDSEGEGHRCSDLANNEILANGLPLSHSGRWLSVDPLEKEFPSHSPYAAFASNPIFYLDPDGRAIRPSNPEAAAVFRTMMESLGGRDLFGLQMRNKGKTEFYTSSLDMSLKQFRRRAEASGLGGDDLETAVALFRVLKARRIFEIAQVDAQTTSNTANERGTDTDNTDFQTFKDAVDPSMQLDQTSTQFEVDAVMAKGKPKGDGFAFLPDQNNTTLADEQDNPVNPTSREIVGILLFTPFAPKATDAASAGTEDGSAVNALRNGIKALGSDVYNSTLEVK